MIRFHLHQNIVGGGKFGNCLAGPALQDDGFTPVNGSGYPTTSVFFVESEGINTVYKVQSPISKKLGSNIYAANFFKPAEHPTAGGVPSCYRGYTVPSAGSTPTYTVPATQTYHTYTCYDRSSEVKARIRLMIREWNEDAQYTLGAAGDSDTSGNESAFDNPLINDFWDLLDLGDAVAPGSSGSFPMEISN